MGMFIRFSLQDTSTGESSKKGDAMTETSVIFLSTVTSPRVSEAGGMAVLELLEPSVGKKRRPLKGNITCMCLKKEKRGREVSDGEREKWPAQSG